MRTTITRTARPALALGAAALALAGCTSASTTKPEYIGGSEVRSVSVTTERGLEVECVVYAAKALSCDWAGAKQVSEAGR